MTSSLGNALDYRNGSASMRKEVDLDDTTRHELYGPSPLNPFVTLRRKAGLTIVSLAATANVDRKAISRLEVGMYTQPLPSMLEFWVRRGESEAELWTAYEDFQFVQRRRHKLFFGPNLLTTSSGNHPFRQLRARRPSLASGSILPVGITECCERLCLPLDTIQFFEKKWRLQQSVPKTLKNVFSQIGYSRDQISAFEANYRGWRNLNKAVRCD